MDCLFTDKEGDAMRIYIKEMQVHHMNPIMYVSPTFDLVSAGIVSMSSTVCSTPSIPISPHDGLTGQYHGIPVYVFDGLDIHTCCIMPQINKGGSK